MPILIDGHQDLAYNALAFGRDYCRSAFELRHLEENTSTPEHNGQALLGWPEYQLGLVAVIFGTVFIVPRRYQSGPWEGQVYDDLSSAGRLYRAQIDHYYRLCDQSPDQFHLIRSLQDLAFVLNPWDHSLPDYPKRTHPVGIIMTMEGAEGIRHPNELEEFWQAGLRLVGPVWAGTRFCGGMYEPGSFTREGYQLLEKMDEIGFVLDIAHMTEKSALQALDVYAGAVIASHANVKSLLRNYQTERHLSDDTIQLLLQHDGVIGVVPFNKFLKTDWKSSDPGDSVTLNNLADHIDYICQMAGDAAHVGFGTDFDGGFGWPAVPAGIDTIADLQKLAPILTNRGYNVQDVAAIFGGNWRKFLERTLPQA